MKLLAPFEFKFAPSEGGTAMTFKGHASVFGNVDAYGDVIDPGAFSQFLYDAKRGAQPWPSMLSQHGGWGVTADDLTPIGVWADLGEDGTGLASEGSLAETQRGKEMHTLMKMQPRPAIDGLSIGYIAKEVVPRSKPEEPRRRIKRADLIEISPVTFPANRLARISSVKSMDDFASFAEIEDYLREAGGFGRGEAKAIIARVKSMLQEPREADVAEMFSLSAAVAAATIHY